MKRTPVLFDIPLEAVMGHGPDGTPIFKTSRCGACGAAMIWMRHPETGLTMPLDAASARDVEGVWMAETHFAVCAKAAHFRRKK